MHSFVFWPLKVYPRLHSSARNLIPQKHAAKPSNSAFEQYTTYTNIILNTIEPRAWLCHETINTFTRIPRDTSIPLASYTSNIHTHPFVPWPPKVHRRQGISPRRNMQQSAQILLSNKQTNITLNTIEFRARLCHETMNTLTRTSRPHASQTSNIRIPHISRASHIHIPIYVYLHIYILHMCPRTKQIILLINWPNLILKTI